jgi:hypothetical protein
MHFGYTDSKVDLETLLTEKGGPKGMDMEKDIELWIQGGQWGGKEYRFPH